MRLAWLIVLVTAATAAADRKVVDRVLAVVDDSVILASELELRLTPLREQAKGIADVGERERRLAQLQRQLLDSMIDDELVVQAAAAARLTVDEKEVDQAIEYIMKEHELDPAQLKVAMAQQGMTRATLRNDILRQRAVAQLVGPKVQVSDEEVRRLYEDNARRGNSTTAVNISQILFTLPEHPTQQQIDEARELARRAMDRVKGGEAFATVATAMTQDTTTKANGGMVGWFDAGTILPEWEPIVFAMDKGEMRGPIANPRGLYIFYANDVKRTTQPPLAKIKDQLADQLRRKALGKLTQAWVEDLRKKAYIEIK